MKLIKSKKYENVYSYKTKKGTLWAIRFIYYDLVGKRREKQQRGFKGELEAHKAALALQMKYADNQTAEITASTMTVAQWVQRYVELNKENWRPNTIRIYNGCFNNYLIPALGNRPLSKLTRLEYEQKFIQPQLKKLAAASVRDNHRVVMALLNSAINYEYLDKNRLSGIKLPKPHLRIAFDNDELKKFNDALATLSFDYQVFFTLLELTGMRRGEAMALTWNDVDLKNGSIRINKTRSDLGTGPTKTSSGTRTVAIAKLLVSLLKKYRLFQREKCFRFAQSFSSDHIVFTTKRNYYMGTQAISCKFKKAIEVAGIEKGKYVVHSLRHTHATFLLNAGVSPADVAKRLGHVNASITMSIYAHAIKGNDQVLAEKVAKLAEL